MRRVVAVLFVGLMGCANWLTPQPPKIRPFGMPSRARAPMSLLDLTRVTFSLSVDIEFDCSDSDMSAAMGGGGRVGRKKGKRKWPFPDPCGEPPYTLRCGDMLWTIDSNALLYHVTKAHAAKGVICELARG